MAMSRLYEAFEQDRWRLETFELIEAIEWLIRNCDDQDFCEAMQIQMDFLSAKPPKAD